MVVCQEITILTRKIFRTLAEVSKAIDLWANYGNAMAFIKNDEILAGIRKYRSDLDEALGMLSVSPDDTLTSIFSLTL